MEIGNLRGWLHITVSLFQSKGLSRRAPFCHRQLSVYRRREVPLQTLRAWGPPWSRNPLEFARYLQHTLRGPSLKAWMLAIEYPLVSSSWIPTCIPYPLLSDLLVHYLFTFVVLHLISCNGLVFLFLHIGPGSIGITFLRRIYRNASDRNEWEG